MSALFDQSFKRRLVVIIESGFIPSSTSKLLSENANQRIIKSDRLRELLHELNRHLMSFMCDFCLVDIINRFEQKCDKSAQINEWPSSQNRGQTNSNTKTRKRWPQGLLLVYILASVMILINTYYSYIYHANTLKLHKLEEHLGVGEHNQLSLEQPPGNLSEFRREFELRAHEARRQLELIGTNHLTWTFVSESIVMVFISTTIISYFIIPLMCKFSGWLLLAPGGLMNKRAECEVHAELVINELKRFSLSSESFAMVEYNQIRHCLDPATNSTSPTDRHHQLKSRYSSSGLFDKFAIRRLELHQDTLELLKKMALEGSLNPLGRTQAARDRQALMFISCFIFMFVYMQTSLFAAYFFLGYILNDASYKANTNFLDLLDAFNLIFTCELAANVALVLMVIFALTIYEQFQSVLGLRLLVSDLIKRNYQNGLDCKQLELDLLTVIMQNRIIVRSFSLAKKPLNVVALLLMYFSIALPLIFKLHGAYFDPRIRWISSIWGLNAAGCCFVYVYMLGLLHQTYIKTFRALWSLAAQLSDFERQISGEKISAASKLSVATLTIRRELSDEMQATDKFTCRLLSIPITNTNIIRIAFYTLLIYISAISDFNVLGDGSTRFMSDPFRLYDFLNGH